MIADMMRLDSRWLASSVEWCGIVEDAINIIWETHIHTVTVLHWYIVTLLHCYIVTLLHCYIVTLLHCYTVEDVINTVIVASLIRRTIIFKHTLGWMTSSSHFQVQLDRPGLLKIITTNVIITNITCMTIIIIISSYGWTDTLTWFFRLLENIVKIARTLQKNIAQGCSLSQFPATAGQTPRPGRPLLSNIQSYSSPSGPHSQVFSLYYNL